jgi:hypothetical protein
MHREDAASREAYADAKADFVRRITEAALAAGYPRDLPLGAGAR